MLAYVTFDLYQIGPDGLIDVATAALGFVFLSVDLSFWHDVNA